MSAQLQEIEIGKLSPADDNPRDSVGDVTELAASIKTLGIIEPLVVTPAANGKTGSFEVIVGNRRLAAAKLAKVKTLPCIVREFTLEERIETMLVENLQRTDLSAIEEAKSLQRLIDECKLTQRDAAARIGRSQAHVSKRLALLTLPEDVQGKVDSGGITLDDAVVLSKVAGDEKAVRRVLKEAGTASYKTVDQLVANEQAEAKRVKKVKDAEAKLRKEVGDDVQIVSLTKGQYGYGAKPPKGMRIVASNGHGPDYLTSVTVAKHQKAKCHAVGIDPHTFQALEICTDPKAHKDVKTKAEKEREKRQAEIREAEAKEDAVRQRRVAWVCQYVQGKPSEKDALEQTVLALMESSTGYYYRSRDEALTWALVFLGIVGIEEEISMSAEDARRELAAQFAKGGVDRSRVAAAIALGDFEANNDAASYEPTYHGILVGLGYELDPIEAAQKEQRDAEEQAEAEAEAEREAAHREQAEMEARLEAEAQAAEDAGEPVVTEGGEIVPSVEDEEDAIADAIADAVADPDERERIEADIASGA